MKQLILLLAFLLLGCTTTPNKSKIAIQFSSQGGLVSHIYTGDTAPFIEKEVDRAIELFFITWLDEVGTDNYIDIIDVLTEFTIVWIDNTWTIPKGRVFLEDGKALKAENAEILGQTLNSRVIAVAVSNFELWETSLIHELTHLVLYNLYPNSGGDPDHLGDEYEGWTEQHSKTIIKTNLLIQSQ